MNGRPPTSTPTPPPIPPSVQQARRQQPQGRRAWTGLWRGRIVGVLVALAVIGVVAAQIVTRTQGTAPKPMPTESTMEPTWGRQTFQYKAEEPILPPEPKPPADTIGPQLAALRAENAAIRKDLEDLKNRKPPAPAVTTGKKEPARATTVPRATPAPMLFVTHDLGKAPVTPVSKTPEYELQPGTWLPCTIEPEMNSEVEGHFTAKVNQNVYDSATHRHLLVPQGSTILGHDQSSQLVYGNERMNTISLKLIPSGGKSVELGNAPITDEKGVIGLTGDVDQHYGRLFGAVFIQGVLKAGQVAITEAAGGTVVSGFTAAGQQATTKVTAPMLNTRPTIKVHSGQLCNVLLTKELKLPAMWE